MASYIMWFVTCFKLHIDTIFLLSVIERSTSNKRSATLVVVYVFVAGSHPPFYEELCIVLSSTLRHPSIKPSPFFYLKGAL